MDKININHILNREKIVEDIKTVLDQFQKDTNIKTRRGGIFVKGETGIGKTRFVHDLLKSLDYDIIQFDAGHNRNSEVIENISKEQLSNKNIYNLLKKKQQLNAIIMDEIDGMNNGDKGGINTLINIMRPKKNKKQLQEKSINSPIFCIGNCHIDKKIKELMKICFVVNLQPPTNHQIQQIIQQLLPKINTTDLNFMITSANNNLTKLNQLYLMYSNNYNLFQILLYDNLVISTNHSNNNEETVYKMITNQYNIDKHEDIIKDSARTSVGLIWHENVADVINNKKNKIHLYRKQLTNICLSDYIDRITFQKQIWEFSEMSSLLKTFFNHFLLHKNIDIDCLKRETKKENIRFTKVLTKYSTEFNNSKFIYSLCQKTQLDKKDLFTVFFLRNIQKDFYEVFCDKFDLNKKETDRMIKMINEIYNETDS